MTLGVGLLQWEGAKFKHRIEKKKSFKFFSKKSVWLEICCIGYPKAGLFSFTAIVTQVNGVDLGPLVSFYDNPLL